ncbi:restriction endonuclease subunit S [Mesorhizobium sp.]|uniref:restriction endonuclease subunit S n=1 Tax=Mesorhizobium sp. TaxID=1871066 RepID=UPI0025C08DF0|nr:restriction endonuclease subunit S [Mesorhizobium sp.]
MVPAETPVSFIPMAGVAEGGGWCSTEVRPISDSHKGYTLFRRGDVIVAKITPCFENGKVALLTGLESVFGLGSTEFHILRAKPGNDPRFVYHWTRHPDFLRAGEASMTGSAGQRRVPAAFFDRFEVVETDGNEQPLIADILDAIDKTIMEIDALIAKLRTVRLGIVDDLLTRGLNSTGSPRGSTELVLTEAGTRPASWKVSPLGCFVPRAEYGTNLSMGDLREGLPVLRMNNIQDGEFDLSDLRYAPTPAVERFRLQKNDVLFNRTNSWEHVGKAAIWRRDEAGPAFASYLVRLHCGNELLPKFLHLWLNWAPVQRAIRQFATPGVQQVNINPTNLRRAVIAMPDTIDEQQAIVNRVDAIAATIDHHRGERGKLANLRNGLRDDLLTGRVPLVEVREAAE